VLVGARSAGELVADVDAASMAIDETRWGEIEALGPG
jgi:hypothetical protein